MKSVNILCAVVTASTLVNAWNLHRLGKKDVTQVEHTSFDSNGVPVISTELSTYTTYTVETRPVTGVLTKLHTRITVSDGKTTTIVSTEAPVFPNSTITPSETTEPSETTSESSHAITPPPSPTYPTGAWTLTKTRTTTECHEHNTCKPKMVTEHIVMTVTVTSSTSTSPIPCQSPCQTKYTTLTTHFTTDCPVTTSTITETDTTTVTEGPGKSTTTSKAPESSHTTKPPAETSKSTTTHSTTSTEIPPSSTTGEHSSTRPSITTSHKPHSTSHTTSPELSMTTSSTESKGETSTKPAESSSTTKESTTETSSTMTTETTTENSTKPPEKTSKTSDKPPESPTTTTTTKSQEESTTTPPVKSSKTIEHSTTSPSTTTHSTTHKPTPEITDICLPTSTYNLTLSGSWKTTKTVTFKPASHTGPAECEPTFTFPYALVANVSTSQSYTKTITEGDGAVKTTMLEVTAAYITIDKTVYELPTGSSAVIWAKPQTEKKPQETEGIGHIRLKRYQRERWGAGGVGIGIRRALGA